MRSLTAILAQPAESSYMTEILFIRHGESEANLQFDRVGGRCTTAPLSEAGINQAVRVGQQLYDADINPIAVFSSPAVRANTTARIALKHAGIMTPITPDERLVEISHASYEGRLRRDVYTEENKRRYRLTELDGKLPGGESVLDIYARTYPFLIETHEQYPEGTVLAFGHGFAIRALAGMLRGFTKPQIFAEHTPNASFTRIDVRNGDAQVRYVGETTLSE